MIEKVKASFETSSMLDEAETEAAIESAPDATAATESAASMSDPEKSTRKPQWLRSLEHEEIRNLLALSDWRAVWSIVLNWLIVAAAMGVVAAWPNLLTIIAAVFVIGARQLGFAVLMHEGAHRTMFRSRWANDTLVNWLCSYPIWSDLHPYRRYHLQHHAKNWTKEDPDVGLATPFPVTPASMRRKVWRDLSGQTGWKRAKATLARDLGLSQGNVKRLDFMGARSLKGVVITNLMLLLALTAFGHPTLYLLWVIAWFTTYSLVMRLRSIAEHAVIPDPADPLNNTRTTLTRWWERFLVAPNCVNYHLEHHLLMTVPHYKLRHMHKLLQQRGTLDHACVVRGYPGVWALAASKPY